MISFGNKKISKNAFFLSLVSLLMDFSTIIVISTMLNLWGGTNAIIQLTFAKSLADSAGFVFRFFSGYLSDRKIIKNNKFFLVIGYGSGIITKFMFFLTTTNLVSKTAGYVVFSIANIVDEFFNKMRNTPRDVLLAESTEDPKHIKINFSFRSFCSFLGSFSGAVFAFFYLKYFPKNFVELFAISLFFSIISVLFLVFKVENVNKTQKKENHEEVSKINNNNKSLSAIFSPSFIFFLLGIFLLYLGKTNKLVINSKGKFDKVVLNNQLLTILYYVGSATCAFILSRFSLNISNGFLLSITLLCLLNSFLFYVKNALIFYLICFFYGLSNGIINSFMVPAILEYFPNKEHKGSIIGFSYLIIGSATILHGFFFKKLLNKFNISNAIISSVSVLTLSLIIFVLFNIFIKRNDSNKIIEERK